MLLSVVLKPQLMSCEQDQKFNPGENKTKNKNHGVCPGWQSFRPWMDCNHEYGFCTCSHPSPAKGGLGCCTDIRNLCIHNVRNLEAASIEAVGTLEAAVIEAASLYSEVLERRKTQRSRERPPVLGESLRGKPPLTKAASTEEDALTGAASSLQAASIEAADGLEASIVVASTWKPPLRRHPVAWRRP